PVISPSVWLVCSDAAHPGLHPFPTRRSSDLGELRGDGDQSGTAGEIEHALAAHFFRMIEDIARQPLPARPGKGPERRRQADLLEDRKSTRLNSSHVKISYAVFCLKKKRQQQP